MTVKAKATFEGCFVAFVDMTMTDDQLQEARSVSRRLTFHYCRQCVERYPTKFEQWDALGPGLEGHEAGPRRRGRRSLRAA